MKKIKVLHCPYNFAGNAMSLVEAERVYGLDSRCAIIEKTAFRFKYDEYFGSGNFIVRELKRWALFIRSLLTYDIIHFNAGHSLMPDWSQVGEINNPLLRKIIHIYVRMFVLKDLAIFKKLGKGVVVTYQGDDARQPEYCRKHFKVTFADEVPESYYNKSYEPFKKWKINEFGKYADRIFATNPDLLHVLPAKAKFLSYTQLMSDDWKPLYPKADKRPPLVVHAPSDRFVKGTKYILMAVERLKKEGVSFEFKLVENTPNNKAVELYRKADLLIDQLLAGWYGKLAVELMALGKPVIAYIRQSDLKSIPVDMKKDLPIINADPETIYTVLKRCVTADRLKLNRLGKQSRLYVEKWHNSLQVAKVLYHEYKSILKTKDKV
ncbi:MAG: glycosyltransferase family 1 protein [Patescibacteria group bacterium]